MAVTSALKGEFGASTPKWRCRWVRGSATRAAMRSISSNGVSRSSSTLAPRLSLVGSLRCFGEAASDVPRWRVMDDNSTVPVEWNFSQEVIGGLIAHGHAVTVGPRLNTEFGCAQMTMTTEHGYIAASDHPKASYRLSRR